MAVAIPYIAMAVTAVGAIGQAQSAASASKYNAAVNTQNALVAEQQGEAAAQAQERDAQRRLGAAVAAYGASGVDITTGSPTDVLADSSRMAALDNLTTRYNYRMRALGYQNQATLDTSSARNSSTAGYLSAIGSAASMYRSSSAGGTPIPTTG